MKSVFLIINLKTLFVTALAVASTHLCIRYSLTAEFPLTLIATAIIFPIVFSINGAYKRREVALSKYSAIKSHGRAIFFATRDWLENPSSQVKEKSRNLLAELMSACRELFSGKIEQSRINEEAVYKAFSDISRFIKEDLRANGLASGEVSRCNQYLSKMFLAFEDAKHIFSTERLEPCARLAVYLFLFCQCSMVLISHFKH